MTPLNFEMALKDFDLALLPVDEQLLNRNPDLKRWLIQAFFEDRLGRLGGSTRIQIDEGSGTVAVEWTPVGSGTADDVFEYALSLLQSGRLAEAEPFLRLILSEVPDHLDALYNLGMLLSDKGSLDDALMLLREAVRIDPQHANAWVAVGVALTRSGDVEEARKALEHAASLAPDNGYAYRNLGAVLTKMADYDTALGHLKKAVDLLPDDPAAHFGLGQCLLELGRTQEADEPLKRAVDLAPSSSVAEAARELRSKIAAEGFRSKGPRIDAVMYCLGALEYFEQIPREKMRQVVFEIAMLGRSGLDVNDPTQKYHLSTMPGKFSGLHLVCYMYVGFRQLSPDLNTGFDLSKEYATAQTLHEGKKPKG